MSKAIVVDPSALPLDRWRRGIPYESSDVSFGARIGLSGLGVSYAEMPPGKSGCPFHNHHVEDELFVILEGEGDYRSGGQRHPARACGVVGAHRMAARRPRTS